MKLPKELTTVTPLSKYFAMVLFISLPFVGFLLGIKYQEMVGLQTNQSANIILTATKPIPTSNPNNTNEWKTYTNERYGYSLTYPLDYKDYNDIDIKTSIDDRALFFLSNAKESNHFFVAVVTKKEYADPHAYNASEYNPFTSNIEKVLASRIHQNVSVINGVTYNRLPDEKIDNKTASVFENSKYKNEGYLVIDTLKYIYVLGRYNGDERTFKEIFFTFKFLDQDTTSITNNGWVEYQSKKLPNNSIPAYIINYPSSWTKNVNREAEIFDTLTLSKNNYSIQIFQAPMGGAMCLFEGELPEAPVLDYRNIPFVQINSGIGTLRRLKVKSDDPKLLSFSFCVSNKFNKSLFGSPTQIGSISYEIPVNYDEKILTEMDKIISTLKVIPQ